MIVRQQSIHRLPSFVRAMLRAAEESGPAPVSLGDTLVRSMKAECVQCGLRMEGEELRALPAPSPGSSASAKVNRLRQGYCARNGCDSYYYHVMLSDHPGIDWSNLIALAESAPDETEPELQDDEEEAPGKMIGWTTARPWVLRAGFGLAGVCLLLLMRQLYMGGTIPFIREPEHFQVDAFETDWHPHRPP